VTSTIEQVQYRLARAQDAAAIAALHAASWQRTYRGRLPDGFLDNEVEQERARVWHQRFTDPDYGPAFTILAELDMALIGFAHTVPDEDAQWGSFLDNLHVREGFKRRGIGRRLMAETAALLLKRAHQRSLYLWVWDQNINAQRFYAALGGVIGAREHSDFGGSGYRCRISWADLGVLVI